MKALTHRRGCFFHAWGRSCLVSKRYMKNVYIDVLEFINTPENHQAIIEFTGLSISVEYTSDGVLLRVIRGAYSVLVAKLGEFIVKESDGSLRICTKEALEAEYRIVE